MDITVNGQQRKYDGDPDRPLLWVLREDLGLTGTKYGCGIAACGACTVMIDGAPQRACATPVSAAAITGLPPEQIKVHTWLTGGSFGRWITPAADIVSATVSIANANGGKAPRKLPMGTSIPA